MLEALDGVLQDILPEFYELRVHQIELEMQNEELRETLAALDISQARYFDLYDLAPVGYCTISPKGIILTANLTAATLLGTDRSSLVNSQFVHFIHREDRDAYYLHLKSLFKSNQRQIAELRVLRGKVESFWVRLESIVSRDEDDVPVCRTVISDITEHRQIEEKLQQSMEGLQEGNQAFKVLLKQREQDRKDIEESVLSNIKHLVLPYVEKLKRSRLDADQRQYLKVLESHLLGIISPFVRNISATMLALTPTEIRVASLIREGKGSKEIADLLGISEYAVVFHRQGIRRKLSLTGKKLNLQTYLRSLQ